MKLEFIAVSHVPSKVAIHINPVQKPGPTDWLNFSNCPHHSNIVARQLFCGENQVVPINEVLIGVQDLNRFALLFALLFDDSLLNYCVKLLLPNFAFLVIIRRSLWQRGNLLRFVGFPLNKKNILHLSYRLILLPFHFYRSRFQSYEAIYWLGLLEFKVFSLFQLCSVGIWLQTMLRVNYTLIMKLKRLSKG